MLHPHLRKNNFSALVALKFTINTLFYISTGIIKGITCHMVTSHNSEKEVQQTE